jgi:hypothetical protein
MCWMGVFVCALVSEWVSELLCELVSEWVSELVRAYACVRACVRVEVCLGIGWGIL